MRRAARRIKVARRASRGSVSASCQPSPRKRSSWGLSGSPSPNAVGCFNKRTHQRLELILFHPSGINDIACEDTEPLRHDLAALKYNHRSVSNSCSAGLLVRCFKIDHTKRQKGLRKMHHKPIWWSLHPSAPWGITLGEPDVVPRALAGTVGANDLEFGFEAGSLESEIKLRIRSG